MHRADCVAHWPVLYPPDALIKSIAREVARLRREPTAHADDIAVLYHCLFKLYEFASRPLEAAQVLLLWSALDGAARPLPAPPLDYFSAHRLWPALRSSTVRRPRAHGADASPSADADASSRWLLLQLMRQDAASVCATLAAMQDVVPCDRIAALLSGGGGGGGTEGQRFLERYRAHCAALAAGEQAKPPEAAQPSRVVV